MFLRVVAHNFLSWEDLSFSFKKSITLLEGYNYDDNRSEGAGKSAILNSLCWGLFGCIPKNAGIDEVVRQGTKDCSVRVELESGMVIVRTRGPNQLYMYNALQDPEGLTPIRGKDTKETQKLIEEMLGMSFETFCQSIYFPQNYPKKFITATEDEKAKILSELQDLDQFDRARKLTAEKIKALAEELSSTDREIKTLNQKVSMHLDQSRRLTALKDKAAADQESRINALKAEIELTKNLLQNALKYSVEIPLESVEALSEQLNDYRNLKHSLSVKKAEAAKDVSMRKDLETQLKRIILKTQSVVLERITLTSQRSPICPTCNTQLANVSAFKSHLEKLQQDEDEHKEAAAEIKARIDAIELNDVTSLDKELLQIQLSVAPLEARYKAAKEAEKVAITSQEQVRSLEKSILDKTTRLLAEKSKTFEEYDEQITLIKTQLEENLSELKHCQDVFETKKLESTRLEILKDGFKELKSHVFRSVLNELSFKSNKYLAQLFNVPMRLEFDNASEDGEISKIRTHVSMDGVKRNLGLYSGGQFRRIQLAVDLALSDLVAGRSGKPMNLRIFDEYFKDLSLQSKEEALRLLEGLPGCTILIEHDEMFKSIISNTFSIELVNGISRQVVANSAIIKTNVCELEVEPESRKPRHENAGAG